MAPTLSIFRSLFALLSSTDASSSALNPPPTDPTAAAQHRSSNNTSHAKRNPGPSHASPSPHLQPCMPLAQPHMLLLTAALFSLVLEAPPDVKSPEMDQAPSRHRPVVRLAQGWRMLEGKKRRRGRR